MDREGLDLQVIYPTLFLARLSEDPAFAGALCTSYNRWLGDVLGGQERLKWVGVGGARRSGWAPRRRCGGRASWAPWGS